MIHWLAYNRFLGLKYFNAAKYLNVLKERGVFSTFLYRVLTLFLIIYFSVDTR